MNNSAIGDQADKIAANWTDSAIVNNMYVAWTCAPTGAEIEGYRVELSDEIRAYAKDELRRFARSICPECRAAHEKKDDWLPAERDEFRGRSRRDWYHSRTGYNGSGVCQASQVHEFMAGNP